MKRLLPPLCLVVLMLASSCPLLTRYPAPNADEAGFVDAAATFASHGYIGAEVHAGLLRGVERHVYWQPPFYFIALGTWLRVFGVGLVAARTFSLLCAILLVLGTYELARLESGARPALLAAALCAVSFWITSHAVVARMDALCVALTVWSLVVYRRAADATVRRRILLGAVAGLSGGLALLTHPLGVVAVGAMLIHAVASRRRELAGAQWMYALAGAFVLLMLVWVAYALQDLASFREQMAVQLQRKAALGSYWQQFRMARSHAPTLTILLGVSGWLCVRAIRSGEGSLIAAAVAVGFSAATFGRETGYFLYFYPYVCCALAMVVRSRPRPVPLLRFAVVLAFANELLIGGYNVYRYRHRNYAAVVDQVRAAIPPGRRVFIALPQVNPYFALVGRNPMRIAVPVPTRDRDAHRRIALASDYVAVTMPDALVAAWGLSLESATPVVSVEQDAEYRLQIFAARDLRVVR